MSLGIDLAERGIFPESVIRFGVHGQVRDRLQESEDQAAGNHATVLNRFVESLRQSPIAEVPELANEQHYEVPAKLLWICPR